MNTTKKLLINYRRKMVEIDIDKILYVVMRRNDAEIHVCSNEVYVTRRTFAELKEILGDSFIEVRRGCLVSALAIHKVSKYIELSNGENLKYTVRKKKEIVKMLHECQQRIIGNFSTEGIPAAREEYHDYFVSYDNMPFAFADIEIVFDEQSQAVDWIFRYANEKLAELERIKYEDLIDNNFGSIFPNMDSKWLRAYECSALYGEILEIDGYSPEIDRHLKIISFPTFRGHCGCILFDIKNIKTINAEIMTHVPVDNVNKTNID